MTVGTGLSYTSTSSSGTAGSKRREKEKIAKWASKQHKTVHIEYPDREPGEPNATQRQKQYILSLADIDPSSVANLGKLQASALIQRLKEEKQRFTDEKVQEYIQKNRSFGCGHVIGVCFLGIVCYAAISTLFNHSENAINKTSSLPPPQQTSPLPPVIHSTAPTQNVTVPTPTPNEYDAMELLAIKQYPQLGVANTPLNKEFIMLYTQYEHTDADYFKNPDWPKQILKECTDNLKNLSVPLH